MLLLGVNIDHVATVRQARGIDIPDPVEAALLAEKGGAGGITVHLREDRRHIQEHDVERLRAEIKTKLNLEMAATASMVRLAAKFRPDDACFVPERREELTTEGGLDVAAQKEIIRAAVESLQGQGIKVNLFIDPDARQIEASRETGAYGIEIHTGRYSNASGSAARQIDEISRAAALARTLGLEVHAGHGLNYENVIPLGRIPEIVELNIGHSIVARAIMVGMEQAVREMRARLDRARAP
ncbi:MAG TPA: pyridoxine 5'-phosphate synthase [Candidatus Binatia bacterium]|nr:pyridoxine 5'-phosphate synthase [Candidatus Binatia bacterium]